MASDERLKELEERYEGYTVYDNAGEKIGKVDDLFVDEADREEYIGVRMGLFGLSGTTLIPMEIVRLNEQDRAIEVAESKERVKDAPNYRDDDEVTQDFEDRIRRHFGLESDEPSSARGSYGRYSGANAGAAGAGETSAGERLGDDRTDVEHSGRPMGGAQDAEVHDERTGAPGTGEATPSGGMRDLETGEPGRATHHAEDDVGNMTRGHREGSDRGEVGGRGDLGSSEQGMPRSGVGDEGVQGQGVDEEGYREGYREGLREGIREGLRAADESGATGERGDVGTSGGARGSEPIPEEGMSRRGTGEHEDEPRETSRPSDEGQQEEGGLTRVWRRISR